MNSIRVLCSAFDLVWFVLALKFCESRDGGLILVDARTVE